MFMAKISLAPELRVNTPTRPLISPQLKKIISLTTFAPNTQRGWWYGGCQCCGLVCGEREVEDANGGNLHRWLDTRKLNG